MHSGHYTKGKDYEGKKVIVVGACTSGKVLSVWSGYAFILNQNEGHDISKDLHDHGAGASLMSRLLFPVLVTRTSSDVTMYQRSSTYVMSVKHGVTGVFGGSFQNFYERHVVTEILWA